MEDNWNRIKESPLHFNFFSNYWKDKIFLQAFHQFYGSLQFKLYIFLKFLFTWKSRARWSFVLFIYSSPASPILRNQNPQILILLKEHIRQILMNAPGKFRIGNPSTLQSTPIRKLNLFLLSNKVVLVKTYCHKLIYGWYSGTVRFINSLLPPIVFYGWSSRSRKAIIGNANEGQIRDHKMNFHRWTSNGVVGQPHRLIIVNRRSDRMWVSNNKVLHDSFALPRLCPIFTLHKRRGKVFSFLKNLLSWKLDNNWIVSSWTFWELIRDFHNKSQAHLESIFSALILGRVVSWSLSEEGLTVWDILY